MRAATAVSSVWRAYAIAFGLGLAIAAMGVGLAHAESTGAPPTQIAPVQIAQGLLPPLPDNVFICQAQPGGWCDLRDWRGFGQAIAH